MNENILRIVKQEITNTCSIGIDIYETFGKDLWIPKLVNIITIKQALLNYKHKWDKTYDISCLIRDISFKNKREEHYVRAITCVTILEIYQFFTIFFIDKSINVPTNYNVDKEYIKLMRRDNVILKRAIHLIENSLYVSTEKLEEFLKDVYIDLNYDECTKQIIKNSKSDADLFAYDVDARIILRLLFEASANLRIRLDEDKITAGNIELLKIVATRDFIEKFNKLFNTCY